MITKQEIEKKTSLNSMYVFILLLLSGSPVVAIYLNTEVVIALYGICLLIVNFNAVINSKQFVVISLFFLAILLLQAIEFNFIPSKTILGFFARLTIGYITVRIVEDFPRYFVKVMYWISASSLVFWLCGITGIVRPLLMKIGPYFTRPFGGDSGYNIIIHNYHVSSGFDISLRNCGIFGEPGWLAGYSIVALIFLGFIKHELPRKNYVRYLLVIVIALLTTMSTTGYICLALIPLLHYDWHSRDRSRIAFRRFVGLYFLLPVLIGGSFVAYNKVPFLKEKVYRNIHVMEYQEGRWHRGRIGSLVFDWEYIKRRPLTGWGRNDQTRYALHPQFIGEPQGMGNGMSDFTAKFGIPMMLVWLFCVFRAMMYLTKRNLPTSMIGMLVIIVLLQGEGFLGHPFFLGLMFLPASQPLPVLSKTYVRRNYRCQAKTSN